MFSWKRNFKLWLFSVDIKWQLLLKNILLPVAIIKMYSFFFYSIDLPSGPHTYRLEDLAYTRSGDKGNSANIGICFFLAFWSDARLANKSYISSALFIFFFNLSHNLIIFNSLLKQNNPYKTRILLMKYL